MIDCITYRKIKNDDDIENIADILGQIGGVGGRKYDANKSG